MKTTEPSCNSICPGADTPQQQRKLFQALLRSDFKSFVMKVFYEVSGGTKYIDNWHIDLICHRLEAVMRGENNRLIINLPPRYMKSIICSIALPAFILGHNPREKIVCVSYSDDLAGKLALDCRRVMESKWYRDLFPLTRLSAQKRSVYDFETTRGGGRFSTSVNGTLTGRGGNWLIVDDPIKPGDTFSDVVRQKTNDWYGHTLSSRLDDKNNGKIVVIMQRLHQADLTGYLLETDSSFSQIRIPLLAIEDELWEVKDHAGRVRRFTRKIGEPLHPARENAASIAHKRVQVGSFIFASQYQQMPESLGAGIIKKEWLQFFNLDELKEQVRTGKKKVRLVQSWDTASKVGEENDYSVCITYARDNLGKVYVLSVFRDRLEFPDLVRKAKELARKCQAEYRDLNLYLPDILVEEMNSGLGLAQTLKKEFGSRVKPVHPVQDKQTRLKSVSHLLENGSCLFPDNEPPWWDSFERELLVFPSSKHDDQCDALSQLLTYETVERPDIRWLRVVS